jgi:CxxC-x17-CxxC domain-containing protein
MKKGAKPDVVELINKLQVELSIIGRKIDTLISKASSRPMETRPVQTMPAVSNTPPKQDNGFRNRVLYKAICADCKKECEVPFKPSGERPVYCKDCFAKRKRPQVQFNGSRPDNRSARPAVPVQPAHINKPEPVEKKKPAAKKKAVAKKKKK